MTVDERTLDLRQVDLWEGKAPAEVWAAFVGHIHASLDRALPRDRADAVARLREAPPAIQVYGKP